jgi:putative ABC transport system permease protein
MKPARWFYTIPLRLRSIFRRRQVEQDLEDELQYHLDMRIKGNAAKGMNPAEARRTALISFGGIDQNKEACRDTRAVLWLEGLARDLRYGCRMLRRNPGFSLAAIITLALCIGANSAILSMLNILVTKPLPYHDAERIVQIYNNDNASCSIAQYLDFKTHTSAFGALALWQVSEFTVGDQGNYASRLSGARTTAEMLDVLGLKPIVGHFFVQDDNVARRNKIVLTQSFWESYFHENPEIVGRILKIDGVSYEVIGVAPSSVEALGPQVRFLIPHTWTPVQAMARYSLDVEIYGRLRPGITIGNANGQIALLENQALSMSSPILQQAIAGRIASVDAVHARDNASLKNKLYLLQAAAFIVLLIGCVNVANLQLARSNSRQKELAVRLALGAGLRIIARQLFVECILLSWLGGALGLVLAWSSLGITNRFIKLFLTGALPVVINSHVLGYTTLIAFVSALVVGLFPTLHIFHRDTFSMIRNQTWCASAGRNARRVSGVLLTAQVAITMVLLVGAVLLIRSFENVMAVEPGFNPHHLTVARLALPSHYHAEYESLQLRERLLDSLHSIPGLTSVSLATTTPFVSRHPNLTFLLRESEYSSGTSHPLSAILNATPSYLETMQMPLVEGRWFNDADAHTHRPVIVVDQNVARRFFAGRSAVGQHLTFNYPPPEKIEDWMEIVGVVGNVRDPGLEEQIETSLFYVYFPWKMTMFSNNEISMLIRSERPTSEVIALLRETVKKVDPALLVFQAQPMERVISNSLGTNLESRRGIMLLLICFACIAVLLTAVGIYGVLAYDISKRTHELGIRTAIGATRKQIVWLVFSQGMKKAGVGLILGIIGALLMSHFMASFLFDVQPTDPLTYLLVSILLISISMLASYLPALRATRIEPMNALRVE